MSNDSLPELVAIVFADSSLARSLWKPILASIVGSLKSTFEVPEHDETTRERYLDETPPRAESRVVELRVTVCTEPSLQSCKAFTNGEANIAFQSTSGVQLVLQPGSLYATHKQPGLAVFDMDSTLIQQEVIDELARAVGLYEQVAAITEAAMRGEAPYTDFEASLRARVSLLNGVPITIWDALKKDVITFTPGAKDLIRALKQLGWKTAVLSGGFTPLAFWVKDTLGLDHAYANQLVSDPTRGTLTGELVPHAPIIHGEKKRELLLQLAADNGIPIERVIAVGDGSNDLPMMGVAGLGIAFNAKPKVQLAAPSKLNGPTLFDIMHILGYSTEELGIADAPPS